MRRRPNTVHPIACACRICAPRAGGSSRFELAIKAATRVLFLIAAIGAIPFIIAAALASAKGEGR